MLELVNAYLAQGMLVPTDMAWYEGAPGWVPLVVVALVAMLFIWKPWGGVDNLPGEEITTSQLFLNTNPVSKPAGW